MAAASKTNTEGTVRLHTKATMASEVTSAENRECPRPIASDASVRPPAKHVKIVTQMQELFPAIGALLVVFGRFLAPRHHRARGLLTCTRLEKMQVIACIKIGNLRSSLPSPPALPHPAAYGRRGVRTPFTF